jgi:hypothetical protein
LGNTQRILELKPDTAPTPARGIDQRRWSSIVPVNYNDRPPGSTDLSRELSESADAELRISVGRRRRNQLNQALTAEAVQSPRAYRILMR